MTTRIGIVFGMTDMMFSTWGRRTTGAALAATLAVAAVFGPVHLVTARLGAGEVVGFSTVTAADTITSTGVLAEVAAAGRRRSVS